MLSYAIFSAYHSVGCMCQISVLGEECGGTGEKP